MAKPSQVLIIKPASELTFVGPFNQQVSSVMYLTNPSDRKVCFKIKTTAPKRYCVKPNSGVVDPDESVKISVSLQPFEFNPEEKNKHKFMVQSMYAPEGEINQEVLWKEADGSQLMDSKLKCVFIVPEANAVPAASNGNAMKSEPPLATSDLITNNNQAAEHSVSSLTSNNDIFTNNKGDTKPSFSHGDTATDGVTLKKSAEEIRKLQEEISTLRQENIQLREELLRQQRLASSRLGAESGASSSGVGSSESYNVAAMHPDANALSTTYLYLALIVLILGIIIGKFVF